MNNTPDYVNKNGYNKHTFYVFGGGEKDTGIPDIDARIEIVENISFSDDIDRELYIQGWKDFISDKLEVDIKYVQSTDEYFSDLRHEQESQLDFEVSQCIEGKKTDSERIKALVKFLMKNYHQDLFPSEEQHKNYKL